jgi:hypothetical protein
VRSCRRQGKGKGSNLGQLSHDSHESFFRSSPAARKHCSASPFLAAGAVYEHGPPRLTSYAITVSQFCLGRSGHPRPKSTAPWTRSCLKIHQIYGSKTASTTYTFSTRRLEPFMKMLRRSISVLRASCTNGCHIHKPPQRIAYASLPFAVVIELGVVRTCGECIENCAHLVLELLVRLRGVHLDVKKTMKLFAVQLAQSVCTAYRAEGLIPFCRCASQHRALDQEQKRCVHCTLP